MPAAEAPAAPETKAAPVADPKATATAQQPVADAKQVTTQAAPEVKAPDAKQPEAKATETAKRPEPTADSVWADKGEAAAKAAADKAAADEANLSPALKLIAREKAEAAAAKAAEDAKAGKTAQPEAKADAKQGDATTADAKAGAEAWNLDAPAWVKPETKARFEAWGKEHNLSKDATQALLNKQSDADVQAYNQEFVTLRKQIEADTEFGGAKLPETMDAAKRALKVLATTEERAFLEKTPYGNHPILIKMLARAGAMLREDGHIGDGKPAATGRDVPTERKLYPGDGKGPKRR